MDDDRRLETARAPREVAAEDRERADLDDDPRVEGAVGGHEGDGRQDRRHDEGDDGGAEPRADALHEAAAERDLLAGGLEGRGEEADHDQADPLLGPGEDLLVEEHPGEREVRGPQRGHDRRAPQQPAPPEPPPHRQHAARVPAVSDPEAQERRRDEGGDDEVAVEGAPRVGAELLDGVGDEAGDGEEGREGAGEEEPRRRRHQPGEEGAPPAVAGPAHLVHVGTGLGLGRRGRRLAGPGLLPPLAVPRPAARHLDERVHDRVRRPAGEDAHLGLEEGEDEEGVRGERQDLGSGIRRRGLDDPAVPLERPDRVRRRGVGAEVRAGEGHPAGERAEPGARDGGHEALLALEAAGERGDDGIRARPVDLLVGGRRTQHRPEELHDGVLEPAAGAEERYALLASPPDDPEDGLVVGVRGPRHEPDAVEP